MVQKQMDAERANRGRGELAARVLLLAAIGTLVVLCSAAPSPSFPRSPGSSDRMTPVKIAPDPPDDGELPVVDSLQPWTWARIVDEQAGPRLAHRRPLERPPR